MDFTESFAIVERDLDILNPISHEKLMLLADHCGVKDGSRVLDIGSGKGYMLREWAKRWEIEGLGLEINPAFASDANERAASENVSERLNFIEGNARDYSDTPGSFDVVTCIGAPFAIGTYDEAADRMIRFLKPGGVLALGEVFLRYDPPEGLVSEETLGRFRSLLSNHDALTERGLEITGIVSASGDDWDHYCSAGWRATHDWASGNPDHPHRDEVSSAQYDARREYLSFQKEYLGWSVLIGAKSR